MLGISKTYSIKKTVNKKLILNDKVANWLYKKIKEDYPTIHYVLWKGYDKYMEITLDLIKRILTKASKDDRILEAEAIVELADDPECEGVPFEVEHASPYDHRWPGDYDEDAYDDWKVSTRCLADFFFSNNWGGLHDDPIYVESPELFDFEDEEVTFGSETLEETRGYF